MKQAILEDFDLKESDFVGEGGEAWVYTLDDDRVLKIYKNNDLSKNLSGLQKLYSNLDWSSAKLSEQAILRYGTLHGSLYTVEKRIDGQDFCKSLKVLTGNARQQALDNYYLRAKQLHTLQKTKPSFFGQAIHVTQPRSKSWSTFLTTFARAKITSDFNPAEQSRILHNFNARVAKLEYTGPPQLVHFDYFPGNVMENDDQIVAIIDFSLAIYGDPQIDIAGAVGFLGLVDEIKQSDSDYLLKKMFADHSQAELFTLTTYLVFIAIFWSYCSEQRVADWAKKILVAWEGTNYADFSKSIWQTAVKQ